MKLLLTGGTGFFGRALIRLLSSESDDQMFVNYHEVVIVTRRPSYFRDRYPELVKYPWLSLYEGDVTRKETLCALDSFGPFDQVLHAATDSTNTAQRNRIEELDQIISGTRNILEFAIKNRAKRFLFTSSGAVYGPQPAHLEEIDENYCQIPDPLTCNSTYGLAKRVAEHLCLILTENTSLEFVIARCFAFVGKDLPLDAHFAIGNFIRDATTKPRINVNGDGTPVRTYMDQRDLARWLLVLLQRGRSGEAYNVGSDRRISIRELAYLVRDTIAPDKEVYIRGDVLERNIRNLYVPAIGKAQGELGLNITYSLRDSIEAAVPCGGVK